MYLPLPCWFETCYWYANTKYQVVRKMLQVVVVVSPTLVEPCHEKTCLCHMRTTKAQISAFVVCCLDSIISLVSILAISCLRLASVAEQTGLFYPVANPEERLCCVAGQLIPDSMA